MVIAFSKLPSSESIPTANVLEARFTERKIFLAVFWKVLGKMRLKLENDDFTTDWVMAVCVVDESSELKVIEPVA